MISSLAGLDLANVKFLVGVSPEHADRLYQLALDHLEESGIVAANVLEGGQERAVNLDLTLRITTGNNKCGPKVRYVHKLELTEDVSPNRNTNIFV